MTYDNASRLKVVQERKSDGSFLAYEELGYDNDGRITSQFLHPKPAAFALAQDTLAYDDDNRLSIWNAQGGSFDFDGNMTYGPLPSGSFGTYAYDARNRLTSAGGCGYRYNPDGLRVEITGSGAAIFVVDPNAALSRTLIRTKAGTTTYYVYGLGLLYEETSGAAKQYHFDHLGNTLALTDASQTVTDRWTYTPFGGINTRTGSTDTPFQFNGEWGVMTDANALLCMRARYYNPRLMRFVNADPIGFGGGLNWYVTFSNNPIQNTDPSGFDVEFTFTDGSSQSVRTADAVMRIANGAAPGSIASISTPYSHGNSFQQVIGSGFVGREDSFWLSDRTGNVYIGGTMVDVGRAFGGKLAPNAWISYDGCETAAGDKNITKATSQALPGTRVTGNTKKSQGSFFSKKSFNGAPVTYLNGELTTLDSRANPKAGSLWQKLLNVLGIGAEKSLEPAITSSRK